MLHEDIRSLIATGRYGEAIQRMEQSCKDAEEKYGREDERVIEAEMDVIRVYLQAGRHDDTERKIHALLIDMISRNQGESLTVARIRALLTDCLYRQDRNEEASVTCEAGLDVLRRILGKDHPETLNLSTLCGMTLTRAGRYTEGQQMLCTVVNAYDEGARNGIDLLQILWGSAYNASSRKAFEEAYRYADRAYQECVARHGKQHKSVGKAHSIIAMVLMEEGRDTEAKEAAKKALEIFRQVEAETLPSAEVARDILTRIEKRGI